MTGSDKVILAEIGTVAFYLSELSDTLTAISAFAATIYTVYRFFKDQQKEQPKTIDDEEE